MFWIILIIISTLSGENARSRFSADRYVRKAKENKIILKGNAKFIQNKNILQADNIELNTKTKKFSAKGNVIFKGDTFTLEGNNLKGSMTSAEGFLEEGKVISGRDIIEGKNIHRVSRKKFLIKEGRYTSCTNDPPDWRLYGNDIDMTIGNYAYLNNVVVEAFGLPVAYIPYLVVPIKYERQSGFLPPDFGWGTDGFNIHESFFLVLSRSQDMTFILGHYGERGRKEGFEFRSIYSKESKSNLYYFHINDKKFASLFFDGEELGVRDRHGLKLGQVFKFYDNTYAKMKILYVSDDNIPRDFAEEIEGRADPALESKLVLMTHTPNISYTMDVAYYEDLLSRNPLDNNKLQLHRLPEVRINVAKTKLASFMLEGDISYLNIYRSGLPFDDFNDNSIYDDGEFIRTGQRLDIYPRLSLPIPTRFLKITPQVGLRYNFYKLPIEGSTDRAFADFRTNITSEISHVYYRGKNRQYRALKHTLEPFVDYRVIADVKRSNHPFFTNEQDGITSPMFDSIDTTRKTNTIIYGITNRLLAKYISNPVSTQEDNLETPTSCPTCKEESEILTENKEDFLGLRKNKKRKKEKKIAALISEIEEEEEAFTVLEPLRWKIYQSYNFLDTTGKPFSYVYSDITASYAWLSLALFNFYNVYTGKLGVSSQLSLSGSNKYLRIGYYYDKTDENRNTDQIKFWFGFNLWRLGTNARFILNNKIEGSFKDKIQDKYFDITYTPSSTCWMLKIAARMPYDRPGFDISIMFNLLISGQAIGFGKQAGFWTSM